eukprot:TCONS_00042316-protein
MNRNEYQRKWRKDNKRIENILKDLSSSEEPCVTTEDEIVSCSPGPSYEEDLPLENIPSDEEQSDFESSSDEEIHNFFREHIDGLEGNCENEEVFSDFPSDLASWILKNKITRTASDELLSLLKKNGHDEQLPKDTRTLLHTPRTSPIVSKAGGEYCYLGIKKGIIRALSKNPGINIPDNCIKLCVNVDGLPIFKSTNGQFWPILCNFSKLTPFTVALYYGTSKPTNLRDFLNDFLFEYASLKLEGLEFEGISYRVIIFTLPCDAPARQFLKCVKAHNGYHGCERCDAKGESISRRMVFHNLDSDQRTNEAFARFEYAGKHQLELTCLVEFGICCVSQFPLDYMHLVCLGVVKRLLIVWKEGDRRYKLSAGQLNRISSSLNSMSGKFPSDFARQPRGLKDLKRWKATEFRLFLLYTGFIVLRDILSEDRYKHFLSLVVAFRILLESNDFVRNENLENARKLLTYFVKKSRYLYGTTFTVYNVHNLVHICDDVEYHNCSLDSISSFPFENHLQFFKKFIRKAQNPLSQIVRRIHEFDEHCIDLCTKKHLVTKLSNSAKDSWFLTGDGNFAQIQSSPMKDIFNCKVYRSSLCQDFFSVPCASRAVNIVMIGTNYKGRSQDLHKSQFLRKAACVEYENGMIVSALLNDIF